MSPIDRREFLKQSGSLAAAAAILDVRRLVGGDVTTSNAAEFIAGKDRRLIVYNAKVGEIETPLELLRDHRLTPKELLFVRNNQVFPGSLTLKPGNLAGWKIELAGLVNSPRTINASELERLEQVEQELVLQCSGNSRSRFARAVKPDGVPWQNGAMGNVRFGGVRLRTVLDALDIRVASEAKFVAAEGHDTPDKPDAADFEHSLPLADALDRSLLALRMNGEPLPLAHGGPVRFVMPGYYATMNVKWLGRLRFEATESTNHHHVGRYRTPRKPIPPGSKFSSTIENSEPNWDMRIKSVVFAPLDGQKLPAGPTEIRGVAWNDGQAKLNAVEVSTDDGRTWQRTQLVAASSPFAWQHWKVTLPLTRGQQTIQCRAMDALGRKQPLDGTTDWNPAGYAWSGVDSVRVEVS
ncbi:MAG: sulfite oxidase [Planctomycetales bacterium]|nr:sulfite oxidase [Planctomycetales bacterium]